MDVIIISRLKTHIQKRLEIPVDKPITISEDNFVELLCYVCEFIEKIQHQNELTGEEKKALAVAYYKRIVLENIQNDKPELIQSVQFFLDRYTGQIIDLVIKASKNQYEINVVPEHKEAKTSKKNKK